MKLETKAVKKLWSSARKVEKHAVETRQALCACCLARKSGSGGRGRGPTASVGQDQVKHANIIQQENNLAPTDN